MWIIHICFAFALVYTGSVCIYVYMIIILYMCLCGSVFTSTATSAPAYHFPHFIFLFQFFSIFLTPCYKNYYNHILYSRLLFCIWFCTKRFCSSFLTQFLLLGRIFFPVSSFVLLFFSYTVHSRFFQSVVAARLMNARVRSFSVDICTGTSIIYGYIINILIHSEWLSGWKLENARKIMWICWCLFSRQPFLFVLFLEFHTQYNNNKTWSSVFALQFQV